MATIDPTTPASEAQPTKKPDLVTLPGLATLVAVVIAAIGNSRESALLTWQLPLVLVAAAAAFAGWRALRARS
jgi:hypothetical protein